MPSGAFFQKGAVALIDALGFQGVWTRHDPALVVQTLRDLKGWVVNYIANQFGPQPQFQVDVAFLSDAIAVSLTFSADDDHQDALAVIYLADILTVILAKSLRSQVPFAYRGAITTGEFYLSGEFVIGPAIDEVASMYEAADAGVIWLSPTADYMVLRRQLARSLPSNTHLVRFPVPMKNGGVVHTFAVSPLVQFADEELEDAVGAFLGTFAGGAIGVAQKRHASANFLRACCEWRGVPVPAILDSWPFAHFNEGE